MQLVLVAGRFPYAFAPGSRLSVHHDREGKPIGEILVMAILRPDQRAFSSFGQTQTAGPLQS
tara:strand:- start:51 stop:236 length:186 start_codon:yes stop_codon:yes gene_type:complete